MLLYIDIETIPAQRPTAREHLRGKLSPPGTITKQESIDKWWKDKAEDVLEANYEKTSFNGGLGEIISIAWAIGDSPVKSVSRTPVEPECGLLCKFFSGLCTEAGFSSHLIWVGHNIVYFDIPFLFKRCIINDVEPSVSIPVNVKPWSDKVFDTMYEWAGTKDRVSLNDLCYYLGIKGKDGIDGSMVWPMVQEGKIKEVEEYNRSDVELVRNVYKKMCFMSHTIKEVSAV